MAKTRVFVRTSLQPSCLVLAFWWWLVVFPWCVGGGVVMCCDVVCDVMRLAARWDEVLWLVVRWRHVLSCDVMSCHAMWCHVMSFDAMYFLLCQVSWCHAMPCECSHVMRCHLRRSEAMQWDWMLWACDAMWLAVRSCCIIRRGCAMWWIGSWCAVNYGEPPRLRTSKYFTPYYKANETVLQSTAKYNTPNYKAYTVYSPTPYCKVLQTTTPYQSITK